MRWWRRSPRSMRKIATGRSCAKDRSRDRAAGRTLVGPQATDMLVRHGPKDIPANSPRRGNRRRF